MDSYDLRDPTDREGSFDRGLGSRGGTSENDRNEDRVPREAFTRADGEKIEAVRTAWRATCKRVGLTGLHVHDLRREFGSRVLESGSSLVEARDLLGHANISLTSTLPLDGQAGDCELSIADREQHEREQ